MNLLKRNEVLVVALILLFLSLSSITLLGNAQGQQTVLRVNVAPMYIENVSMAIGIEGLYAVNDIPQAVELQYNIQVYTANGTYVEGGSISEQNGFPFTYYLPGIPRGYYYLTVDYTVDGVTSSNETIYFIVAPPPVPYVAFFLSNGEFVFHSEMLNATGKANQSYWFHVSIAYQYQGGTAQIINVFNTTNMTFMPVNEGQIVVVNIQDRWGWLNSAGINIKKEIFTGPPLIYSFSGIPAPYSSVWLENIIVDIVLIAALLGAFFVYLIRRRRKKLVEDYYE
ncbi:MAG: hypothetical protein QW292_05830 [Candidatus Parvarchaeota archaeon]